MVSLKGSLMFTVLLFKRNCCLRSVVILSSPIMQLEIWEPWLWSSDIPSPSCFPSVEIVGVLTEVLTWHTHVHPSILNFDCIITEMLQALGLLHVCNKSSSSVTHQGPRKVQGETNQQGEGPEMPPLWRWTSVCSLLTAGWSLLLSPAPWRPINLRTRCPTSIDLSHVTCDLHILRMPGLLQGAVRLRLSF